MVKYDFYTFAKNGNFSDYNISMYEKDHSIDDKKLIKSCFKFLYSYLPKLKNNEHSINIAINVVNLICILLSSNEFSTEEIDINKKRIITAKKMILNFLKKHKNINLFNAIDKLDSIILDKEINLNDLLLLINKLIERKEYDVVISKIINLNKKVLELDNCKLFDKVFKSTTQSLDNKSNDIYYYISLLKILYSNRINKDYYILLLDRIKKDDLFYHELYSIINGKLTCLNNHELLEKYSIITTPDYTYIKPPISDAFNDKIITIDNFNTRINDDGISFKKDGNNFIVGIHIADVASFIKPKCIVDYQARQNFKTIYTDIGSRISIFDSKLEECMSLNQGQTKPSISIYAIFNSNYDIIDYYLVKNNVNIQRNFHIYEAEELLNGNKWDEQSIMLNELYNIADFLNHENKAKERYWKKKNSDFNLNKSEIIVSEFSILFNKLIALISYNNGYTYVYKYQDKEYITELTQKLNIRKCDLLDNVLDNIYLNSAYSLVPKLHNGLNEPIYSSSTNPLRNYPDIFNQYLIHSQHFNDLSLPYSDSDIECIVKYFNERKLEIMLLNREINKTLKMKKHS